MSLAVGLEKRHCKIAGYHFNFIIQWTDRTMCFFPLTSVYIGFTYRVVKTYYDIIVVVTLFLKLDIKGCHYRKENKDI